MRRLALTAFCFSLLMVPMAAAQGPGQEVPAKPVPASSMEPIRPKAPDETFHDGPFDWLFSASWSSGDVSGYGKTEFGGMVTAVTVCTWNDSLFTRTFQLTATVDATPGEEGGSESITFSRSYTSLSVTCHEVTGFNATVNPGEFEISATFEVFTKDALRIMEKDAGLTRDAFRLMDAMVMADDPAWTDEIFLKSNIFAWMPGDSTGETRYDCEINGQRPPFAPGSILMHGVGLEYQIDRLTTPPLAGCDVSDFDLCTLRGGRFEVTTGRPGDSSFLDGIIVDGNDGSGLFRFSTPKKWELLVNIQPRAGAYKLSASGLTEGRSYDIHVRDTVTGQTWDFVLPDGNPRVTNQPLSEIE